MEDELLNAPIGNLAGQDFVIVPAIEFMHGHEFLELFSAAAKFSEDATIQFHLIDFSVVGHVRGARGIRAIEILMLPWGDADCPRRPNVNVGGLKVTVVVEHVELLVGAVAHIDIASMIDLNGMNVLKLPGPF